MLETWEVRSLNRYPGPGRLDSKDAHYVWYLVKTEVADRTTSAVQIKANVNPRMSTWTVGNRYLNWSSGTCVSDQISTPIQCCEQVLPSCKWFLSAWWAGERRLSECICPWGTGSTLDIIVCDAINYNSRSPLVFVKGALNSPKDIQNISQSSLLPFL